jgi:hypothetical protein
MFYSRDLLDRTLVKLFTERRKKLVGPKEDIQEQLRGGSFHGLDRFLKLCCLSNICDWAAAESNEVRHQIEVNLMEVHGVDRRKFWTNLRNEPYCYPNKSVTLGKDSEN